MTNRLTAKPIPVVLIAGKPSLNRRRVLEQWVAVSEKSASCVLVTDSSPELSDAFAVRKVSIAKDGRKSAVPDELVEAIKAEVTSGTWKRLIIETPYGWPAANIAAFLESCRKEETDIGNLVSILSIDAVPSGEAKVDSYEIREIEFASRILLPQKASDKEEAVRADWMKSINPGAERLPSAQAISVPEDTQAAGGFRNWIEAGGTAWHRVLIGNDEMTDSFVFRARVPFHPVRWREAVNGPLKEALRVRGIFWIGSRMADVGSIDYASGEGGCRFEGKWWAAQERSSWPKAPQFEAMIAQRWHEPFGDRMQELVILNSHQDKASLIQTIQGALLTEAELELIQDTWKAPAEAHAASHDHHGHDHKHGHDHGHNHDHDHHGHGENCGCGSH